MTKKSNTLKEKIIQQLRTIYDLKIPVNIVELGLVYEVKVEKGIVTIE